MQVVVSYFCEKPDWILKIPDHWDVVVYMKAESFCVDAEGNPGQVGFGSTSWTTGCYTWRHEDQSLQIILSK